MKEKWYGTPYSIEKLDDELLSKYAASFPPEEYSLGLPP